MKLAELYPYLKGGYINMMKKMMVLLLASILMVGTLAGCQKDSKTENTTQKENEKGNKTSKESEKLEGHLVSKDPMELSIHLHLGNRISFKDSWEVFKKAEELTNVKLKGTASDSISDSAQAFNTMLASGDLSDILTYSLEDLSKYGMEGALISLNDLIEEHAPNFNKYLQENPDVRKTITAADGNIYSIAFVPDGEAAAGYFMRTDWLEKLNLEVPKTVDDYYNVLKAFKERDPNGNNKADEIPFIDRGKGEITIRLVTLFGGHTSFYLDGDTVKYGPSEEAYKIGMENISKWYAEGLIDPEAFTRGSKARNILLGDNVGGATHDWFGSTSTFNDTLADKIQGFKFEPIAPPADINGKVWESTIRNNVPNKIKGAWGISVSNPHPVETIKYFDFWWSEEGRRLMNFGIEGEQYDLVDGKPIFKESLLNNDEPVISLLEQIGAQIQIGFHQDFAYEEQWMNPVAKQGARMYIDGKYCEKAFPSLVFTNEEQDLLNEKLTAIDTLQKEVTQKWILNAEDVNTGWDKYIKAMNNLGLKEVLEVYQNAYDRYMAQ